MRPPYLRRTFFESGDGLHFTVPPPLGIDDTRNLASDDPWVRISCVLANLQQGHFEVSGRLIELMHETDDAEVWTACAQLLAFGAPYSTLRKLVASFTEHTADVRNPYVSRYFSEILAHSAAVWGVPYMLHIYQRLQNREVKLAGEVYFSQVLEEERGAVWEGPREELRSNGLPPPFEEQEVVFHDAEYVSLVGETYEKARAKHALRENDSLWEGSPLDLRSVARRLLNRLRAGEDSDRVEMGRMLLEATTGLNCSAFFNEDHQLQSLSATAIVEEFLAGGEAERYQAGSRYFFGHRVPL